ncbi:MAG: hypothetical protein E6Q84_01725 [Thiothrix sp.]|nr:MAG: hypothetical protein E6Q84_01725 [Thiothrix sp.]
MKIIKFLIILLLASILSFFAVKGDKNSVYHNSSFLESYETSPFESSHSSSRYALVKSLFEDNTIFLKPELAALASPDLSKLENKYISIFTPGVSFLSLPAYALGNLVGFPQLFAFGFVTLVSVFNIYLVAKLASKMGAKKSYAIFSGLVYGFATNALAYSGTLTQHSISVAIGLLLTILLYKDITFYRVAIFGLLYGLGVMVDIPNAILFMPQLIYYFFTFFRVLYDRYKNPVHLAINSKIIILFSGLFIPLLIFGLYNNTATGSPFKLGQRLGRAIYPPESVNTQQHITPSVTPVNKEKFKQFDTERQIRGYYTLIFSDTRGIFYYFPVLLIGVLGIIYLWISKLNTSLHAITITTIVLNLILYATFNDPWGGWAFGPRYLLPTSAYLCVFLGIYLSKIKGKIVPLTLTLILLIPSAYVSVAGAITTTVVPPDIYTESLVDRIPDDYQYNLNLIKAGKSSSLPYNLWISPYLRLDQLHYLLTATMLITIILPIVLYMKDQNE